MLDEDYTSSILIKALGDALKEMQAQLLLTRDVAESLYFCGISTMRSCMEQDTTKWLAPKYSTLRFEAHGRIDAYRGHRSNWTIWARTPYLLAKFQPLPDAPESLQPAVFKVPLPNVVRLLIRGVPPTTNAQNSSAAS